MRYEHKPSFFKSIKRMDHVRKEKIRHAVRVLVNSFESQQKPHGIGLKHLHKNYWEIRANIKDRILFRWAGDLVEFIIAGDHDDLSNYLKNI
ncbi:MAG: hypothetical protein ABSH12_03970 [Endomicrobiales bacterium]